MASLVIDPRSGSYYAQFNDKDRRSTSKRVSLTTKRKRVAERAFVKLEDAYALGVFDPWEDLPWRPRMSATISPT